MVANKNQHHATAFHIFIGENSCTDENSSQIQVQARY